MDGQILGYYMDITKSVAMAGYGGIGHRGESGPLLSEWEANHPILSGQKQIGSLF